MDMKEVKAQRQRLEKAVFRLLDDFEIQTDCIVEGIALKRRHIEDGIGSRTLDAVMIRITIG